jgi:hypothetical protein
MAEFAPFRVPVVPYDAITGDGDVPLVTPAGTQYRCSGCGALVPPGVWITETVVDGMVVGLSMRLGADGPHVHACGQQQVD